MKNPKAVGNEYENLICSIIEEMLGVEFKRTKMSGGDLHKGDIRDWTKGTPLSRYCIEIKYHGSVKEFNAKFRQNIWQAQKQSPADKNWLLVIHLPKTDIELVVMDLKDYLCNDILGQMTGNREDLKKELLEIDDLLYKLRKKFENLKGRL